MYQVVTLDFDGCTLAENDEDTLTGAKAFARDRAKEREYIDAGMRKVEVRDARGRCLYDVFAENTMADKLHSAEQVIRRAQNKLGANLGGFSVTDLLADNFPDWTLEDCRNVAAQLGA